MSFNLKILNGITIEQVREAMNYKQFLKADEEVEGIRVKPGDDTNPVLLSVVIHNDDERKSDPIQ